LLQLAQEGWQGEQIEPIREYPFEQARHPDKLHETQLLEQQNELIKE
jgi:hypothetical protein